MEVRAERRKKITPYQHKPGPEFLGTKTVEWTDLDYLEEILKSLERIEAALKP